MNKASAPNPEEQQAEHLTQTLVGGERGPDLVEIIEHLSGVPRTDAPLHQPTEERGQ
ncbi:MAG: hypothetical protein RhofKO_29860 [Rhodothermales bacterium]